MKDKVLFAKTGIARFMALLVTLLTMFASCNFVGGQDARGVELGTKKPDVFVKPDPNGSTLNGVFKNKIKGTLSVTFWGSAEEPVGKTEKLPELIPTPRQGWWGGAFGWIEKDPWAMPRNYDISGITKCSYDIVASMDVNGVYVAVFPSIDYKGNNDTADTYCEIDWEDKESTERKTEFVLKANQKQSKTVTFEAAYGKSINRSSLIGFGGGADTGYTVSITNITFYDQTGKEVVPKPVEPN